MANYTVEQEAAGRAAYIRAGNLFPWTNLAGAARQGWVESAMVKPLVMPTINLNGTSANTLLDTYCNARQAVLEAMKALQEAEFHPRDYMQQANGAAIWKKAQAEHEERLLKLHSIEADLLLIAEHVSQFIKH